MNAQRIVLFLLLVFVITAGQGCTSVSNVAATEPMPREGNVILVRGLMDVFSLGLHDIEHNLTDEGVNAHVCSGPRWPSVSDEIKREYSEGKLEGPLVIVGHSYGADDAVRLARSLGSENIKVDMLALIDPTTPPKIPTNVVNCFNLYKSSPTTDWLPLLRGIPVEAESETTQLVNFDIRKHNEDGRFSWNNHFNIEEDEDVQAVIVEQVLKFCPPNGHYAGASSTASTTATKNTNTNASTGTITHATGSGATSANGSDNFADAQPR